MRKLNKMKKTLFVGLLAIVLLTNIVNATITYTGNCNTTMYVTARDYNLTITEGIGYAWYALASDKPTLDWAIASNTLGLNYEVDQNTVSNILVKTDGNATCTAISGNNTNTLSVTIKNNASKGAVNITYTFYDNLFTVDVWSNVTSRSYDYHKNATSAGASYQQDLIYNSTTKQTPATATTNSNDTLGVVAIYYNNSAISNYTAVIAWNVSFGLYNFGYESQLLAPETVTALGRQTGINASTTMRKTYKIIPINQSQATTDGKVLTAINAFRLNYDYGNGTIPVPRAPVNYYFNTTGGSDANTCLTTAQACTSISKLNNLTVLPGDNVSFQCGSNWSFIPTDITWVSGNASANVTYNNYGSCNLTNLPKLTWSTLSISTNDWYNITSNLWKYNGSAYSNYYVGNLILNYTLNNRYNYAVMKQYISNLSGEGQFSTNASTSSNNYSFYIQSNVNPITRWNNGIKVVLAKNCVDPQSGMNMNFYGLHITECGKDGYDISNTNNTYFHDNQVSIIGGGDCLGGCSGWTRWGNAIQIWRNSQNSYIYNNYIWEVFDTCLTTQSTGNGSAYTVNNHQWYNNTCTNVNAGIEYFSGSLTNYNNISFTHNTFYKVGTSGFESQRTNFTSQTLFGYCWRLYPTNTGSSSDIVIKDNICYDSESWSAQLQSSGSTRYSTSLKSNITMDYNYYSKNHSRTSVYGTTHQTYFGVNETYYPISTLPLWQTNENVDLHSVNLFESIFIDADNPIYELKNFTPITGSTACTMSSTASFVGTQPCVTDTITGIKVYINNSLNNTIWGTDTPPREIQYYFDDSRERSANCSLLINDVIEKTSTGLTENTWRTFTSSQVLNNGFYNVSINCTNSIGITNASNSIIIEVQSPLLIITNLSTTSKDLTWVYVTWTNPENVEWSYNKIYLDGTFLIDTNLEYYNFTGLNSSIHNVTLYPITVTNTVGIQSQINITTRSFPIVQVRLKENSPNATGYTANAGCAGLSNPTYSYDNNPSTGSSPNWATWVYPCYQQLNYTANQVNGRLVNTSINIKSGTLIGDLNFTNKSCIRQDGKLVLYVGGTKIDSSHTTGQVLCENETNMITLYDTTPSNSATLEDYVTTYEVSVYRDYETTQELAITGLSTLNGSAINSATICNSATSNCTSGSLPLYLAMFNGTQSLTITTDGNWDYTTTYTSNNNESTTFTGITNTIITWQDSTTNSTLSTPPCYTDYTLTDPITHTNNNYYLADGNYDIYCLNTISEIQNITINKDGPLNLTAYIIHGNISVTTSTCTNGDTAIYFQILDEQNFTRVPSTIKYNLNFNMITHNYTFYGILNNADNFSVCIDSSTFPSWTIQEAEIQYSSTNYVDRRYYLFQNTRITSETTNITLYSLLSSEQTSFKLAIESNSLIPYDNKYTSLIRWYPNENTYSVVDMGKTDVKGETVIHVETEDVDYRIGVYELDGTLIYLASPIRMVCLTTPCTYTIKIPAEGTDYISFLEVQTSLTYNETNGIWTFIWNDPSQTTSLMNMTIYKDTGTSTYEICNSYTTGTTGAITCDTSAYTGKLRAVVQRSASPPIPIATLIIETLSTAWKSTWGLWLSFLIVVPIVFVFALISPIAGVIGGIVALIPAWYLGSISFGIIAAITVLGGIVIHFAKRVVR